MACLTESIHFNIHNIHVFDSDLKNSKQMIVIAINVRGG